jgi:hypothetical protein
MVGNGGRREWSSMVELSRSAVVTASRLGARSAVLLVCAVAVLAGCGGSSQLDVAFRMHVTQVCRHVKMASPVTALEYAKQQRQDSRDIATLARLHPPDGERQTYGDLLMHLNRIHAFYARNESRAIALNLETAHSSGTPSSATLRRVQRFLRPIAADTSAVFHDTSALQIHDCPALVGL